MPSPLGLWKLEKSMQYNSYAMGWFAIRAGGDGASAPPIEISAAGPAAPAVGLLPLLALLLGLLPMQRSFNNLYCSL